jgi:hypothetical protein
MLWFKTCRPLRLKYRLSTNCLLMLAGCYCYNTIVNKPFTINQILKFVTYYNPRTLKIYLNVLINKDYVCISYNKSSIVYYSITLAGIQVINELNDSYQIELRKFIDQYNIVL